MTDAVIGSDLDIDLNRGVVSSLETIDEVLCERVSSSGTDMRSIEHLLSCFCCTKKTHFRSKWFLHEGGWFSWAEVSLIVLHDGSFDFILSGDGGDCAIRMSNFNFGDGPSSLFSHCLLDTSGIGALFFNAAELSWHNGELSAVMSHPLHVHGATCCRAVVPVV